MASKAFVERVHRYAFISQAAWQVAGGRGIAIDDAKVGLENIEVDEKKKLELLAILEYNSKLLEKELSDAKLITNWPNGEPLEGITEKGTDQKTDKDPCPNQTEGISSVVSTRILAYATNVAARLVSHKSAFTFTERFMEEYRLSSGAISARMAELVESPLGTQTLYTLFTGALIKDIRHFTLVASNLGGNSFFEGGKYTDRKAAYENILVLMEDYAKHPVFLHQFFRQLSTINPIDGGKRHSIQDIIGSKLGDLRKQAKEANSHAEILQKIDWTKLEGKGVADWKKELDELITIRGAWGGSERLFDSFIEEAAIISYRKLALAFGVLRGKKEDLKSQNLAKAAEEALAYLYGNIHTTLGIANSANQMARFVSQKEFEIRAATGVKKEISYPSWKDVNDVKEYASYAWNNKLFRRGKGGKIMGYPDAELKKHRDIFSDGLERIFDKTKGEAPDFADPDKQIDQDWIKPLIYHGRSLLSKPVEKGKGVATDQGEGAAQATFDTVFNLIKAALGGAKGKGESDKNIGALATGGKVVIIANPDGAGTKEVGFFDAISADIYPLADKKHPGIYMRADKLNVFKEKDEDDSLLIDGKFTHDDRIILEEPYWGYALAALFRIAFAEQGLGDLEPIVRKDNASNTKLKADALSAMPNVHTDKALDEALQWAEDDLSSILGNGNTQTKIDSPLGW